jgi:ribosome maturation factor RimP
MSKPVEKKIAGLIAVDIDAAGYELVRVQITGGGRYSTLQIMAERRDGVGMTVEDCAALSRLVSEKIEADKELADRYDLEVSSPGIDRPLVKLSDFERFVGHVAKVELGAPLNKMKRFEGKIARVLDDVIEFETDKGAVSVAFAAIDRAKLVLTDDLLKAAASGKVSH